jgi:hypothetical protein
LAFAGCEMAQKVKPNLDDPGFWLEIAAEFSGIVSAIETPASRIPLLVVVEIYTGIAQRAEERQGRRAPSIPSIEDLPTSVQA